jgi:hypothetical protein
VGFYDLAIAAPSMKAALEAWGAGSNRFHQVFEHHARFGHRRGGPSPDPRFPSQRPAGSGSGGPLGPGIVNPPNFHGDDGGGKCR